jgi:hypothetical protein
MLIKPIQRITRYPLLLSQLMVHSTEKREMQMAYEKMLSITREANDRVHLKNFEESDVSFKKLTNLNRCFRNTESANLSCRMRLLCYSQNDILVEKKSVKFSCSNRTLYSLKKKSCQPKKFDIFVNIII